MFERSAAIEQPNPTLIIKLLKQNFIRIFYLNFSPTPPVKQRQIKEWLKHWKPVTHTCKQQVFTLSC